MNSEKRTEPSRFDYVKYDDVAVAKQAKLKAAAQSVESAVALNNALNDYDDVIVDELTTSGFCGTHVELARDRATGVLLDADLALVALEESYMWCGKAIRDEQLDRTTGVVELQEERTNS